MKEKGNRVITRAPERRPAISSSGPGVTCRKAMRLVAAAAVAGLIGLLSLGFVMPHLLYLLPGAKEQLERLADAQEEVTLFAHRGGVQLADVPDNTLAAFRAAIERGYYGVEIDVRETMDGVLIAHHDAGFERYFAESCEAAGFFVCHDGDYAACLEKAAWGGRRLCHVDYMTGREVLALRHAVTGLGIPTLEAYLRTAGEAEMEVMLDFKQELTPSAITEVEQMLNKYLPDRQVYFIGRTAPKLALFQRARNSRVGVLRATHPLVWLLAYVVGRDGGAFLFQNGLETGERDVLYASAVHVELIPSVNWHHFIDDEEGVADDLVEKAHRELTRLYELGIRKFQIDSDFDDVFFTLNLEERSRGMGVE